MNKYSSHLSDPFEAFVNGSINLTSFLQVLKITVYFVSMLKSTGTFYFPLR
jgi:hypothetical protein